MNDNEINDSEIMEMFSKSLNTIKDQYQAIDNVTAELQHLKLLNKDDDESITIYYNSIVEYENRAYKHAKIVDTLLNCIKEFDKLTLEQDKGVFIWTR